VRLGRRTRLVRRGRSARRGSRRRRRFLAAARHRSIALLERFVAFSGLLATHELSTNGAAASESREIHASFRALQGDARVAGLVRHF
jgi:hypothetical protein